MLNGKLQKVDWTSVSGWARDTRAPGTPVALTVSIDGEPVGRVLANQYRPKLEKHGNKGHVGFTLRLGRGLAPDARHQVEVCRESDSAPLPGSPWLLEPPADLDESVRAYLAQLVDQGGMGEAKANIEFLAGQAGKLLQRSADAATGKEARAALRLYARRWSGSDEPPPPPGKYALMVEESLPAAGSAILRRAESLKQQGFALLFAPADMQPRGEGFPVEMEVTVLARPFCASVEEALRSHKDAFELVAFGSPLLAQTYGPLAQRFQPKAKLVVAGPPPGQATPKAPQAETTPEPTA